MRGWRGILGGILGLSVLYVLVQPGAAGRVGGLLGDTSKLINNGIKRLSDPSLAGLRDFRKAQTAGKSPSTQVKGKQPSAFRGPR